MDRFASEFPSWSPYHYANNNPISNIDFNGDSTRVYNTAGGYQMTINDDLPNEDHFYTNKQLDMLCNTSSCGTVDEQGQFYRDNSSFFIGSKTRSELESIRSFSKGEEGFLLIPGKDRQLTLYNAHKFKSSRGSNHFTFNTDLIPSMGQVGAGHTHEGSSGASPHSTSLGLADYRPILNRKGGRDIQPHLMIVGGSSDFSIYTSAREIWTPTIYVSGRAILGGHFDFDFPGGERPAIKVRYNGTSAN